VKVSVIGSGYVGLTTGICLARGKNEVILMDIDEKRVDMLACGDLPIYEPGLKDLFNDAREEKKIWYTSSYEAAVKGSDISFVCVGTPSGPDGSIDKSYVEKACDSVVRQAIKKKDKHTIVVRSTVVPGTTEEIIGGVRHLYFKGEGRQFPIFAMHPEHLAEGSAVEDFLKPQKIVVGEDFQKAGDTVLKVYNDANVRGACNNAIIHRLSIKGAETEKYDSNIKLAFKVAMSNELANMHDLQGTDYFASMKAVHADERTGNARFTIPGIGFGGSCFTKDYKARIAHVKSLGYNARLLKEVLASNYRQPKIVADAVFDMFLQPGDKVNLYGVTFKGNTDDLRETPVLPFMNELKRKGVKTISLTDPWADKAAVEKMFGQKPLRNWKNMPEDANLFVITSDHDEYKKDKDFVMMLHAAMYNGSMVFDAKYAFPEEKFPGVGRMYLADEIGGWVVK